MENKKNRSLTV